MTYALTLEIFYNMSQILTHLPDNFDIRSISQRPEPRKVLLCTPDFFEIVDVKNVYMEGQEGAVNSGKMREEWNQLHSHYISLQADGTLDAVMTIPGEPGLEDMVFCANQTFPWITASGEKVVIMSKMRHESRQREVIFFERFFKELGYQILHLHQTDMFEGMGDCIPHPGRRLLYGGWGHRSHADAYREISEILEVDVLPLQLVDERFYHLDTCFLPLNENTVLLCPDAFTTEGLQNLRRSYQNVIEINAAEVATTFSLNAHTIWNQMTNAGTAIIQPGGTETIQKLKANGFRVIETQTGEFMKSGGSVFCMKMMLY
jgi:N-dimethylarginine dimethylaminohydrolase